MRDLFKNLNDNENRVRDTKSQKEELDIIISKEIERIKNELYSKLTKMIEDLRNHQMNQRADALKLQQEISMLKKEKLDLYQKINEVSKRIADMELTIGQDMAAK
jgi:predicted  nucleic acid-binding Zn-ribbon protein